MEANAGPPLGRVGFRDHVRGRLGEFRIGDWRVGFLLSKARLGGADVDPENRLTRELKPFREVIPVTDLRFGELLQRDLNDYRVAEGLVPYILGRTDHSPLFPPALVVVLPFIGQELAGRITGDILVDKEFDRDGLSYLGTEYGDAFRVGEMLSGPGGDLYEYGQGSLEWNPERCKLVVLDGQHRIMALLAIQRTDDGSWRDTTGSEYAPFYVDRVQKEIDRVAAAGNTLEGIELPIMICWFPTLYDTENAALQAARTVFVAVNSKAEPPTAARTALLSDDQLQHVFTREILERLRPERGDEFPLPLTAIEFDNPDEESARPERWNAITNVGLLGHVVRRCVFGPEAVLTDVSANLPRGVPRDADLFMRRQLNVEELFAGDPPEGVDVLAIGDREFPHDDSRLTDAFWRVIGAATVEALGRLMPYAAHHETLEALRLEWIADQRTLWYRALFEGSGLYWSIKRSYESWSAEAPENEVVAAWRTLHEERRSQFFAARAEAMPTVPESWGISLEQIYRNTFTTHACELGLMLSMASVAMHADRTASTDELAIEMIRAWNVALGGETERGDSRVYCLVKGADPAINRIENVNVGSAVYFRYFWLELLANTEGASELSEPVRVSVQALARKGRGFYLGYLIDERVKDLQRLHGEAEGLARQDDAVEAAVRQLRDGLEYWTDLGREHFEEWLEEWETEEEIE